MSLVSAQRLVRKLCTKCRQPDPHAHAQAEQAGLPDAWLQAAPEFWRAHAQGCSACHRGYSGRTGLFEVMPVTPAMQSELLAQASEQTLTQLACQCGVLSLRQAGWRRVLQGQTSVDEVLANTPEP